MFKKYHQNHWINISNFLFLGLALFLVVFLFVIPIAILLVISFSGTHFGSAYAYIFENSSIFMVLFRTIWISLATVIICLFSGYFISYIIYKMDNNYGIKACLMLIISPLLLNSLIKIIALKLVLAPLGLIGTPVAIIIGLIYIYIPYMLISIYFSLVLIDKNIINSSYDLGASKIRTFFHIILPLTKAGILNGSFLVFFSSLTTVIVSSYLGLNQKMIGNVIINYFTNGGNNMVIMVAITIIISIIMLILIIIGRFIIKRKKGYK